MKARFEKWHPLFFSITLTVFLGLILKRFSFSIPPSSITNLLTAIISLSGITVGFLATTMSILLSLDSKQIIVELKRGGQHRFLINYLMDAINYSFGLAIISIVGLLVDFSRHAEWHFWAFTTWCFILILAGISYHRIIRIFVRILRS